MKSNINVILDFFNNKESHSRNVFSFKDVLVHYGTTLLHRFNNQYIFNKTKYSITTSKIQTYILYELKKRKINYIEVTNIPINTKNLIKY